MSDNKFTIVLRENGLHSLWRGIEAYEEYDKTRDKMLLKDAIMFLHHGVELLMKEILVKHSPFLIFEDLRDASKKQKQADSLGLGIFFLEKSPKTVTFEDAILRVDAFVKPPQLTAELQSDLAKLNQLRNQLEHYAIEADVDEVVGLLAKLQEPLLDLFDSQIGGIRQAQPPKATQAWKKVQSSAKFYSELEREVFEVVQRFKGQTVPGYLFNVTGDFTLPTFTNVQPNSRIPTKGQIYEIDVFAEGDGHRWAIEVKGSLTRASSVLDRLTVLRQILHARVWLIAFEDISPDMRETAKELDILLTGHKEWQALKQLV